MARLQCTVRGCGALLERVEASLRCPVGHSFDVARSGHVNLLQAADRRSATPGDSRDSLEARDRFLERGLARPLVEALAAILAQERPGERLGLLDVGCGSGWFLRALAGGRDLEPHGMDISARAVESAARRQREATFVVANADRPWPFEDAAFDVVTSLHARVSPGEMWRTLTPGGLAIVVVPGPGDLQELREAVLGEGIQRRRMERVDREMAERFVKAGERSVSHVARMDPATLRDALAATYRGARRSERQRVEALEDMDVTVAHDVAWWRPAPS